MRKTLTAFTGAATLFAGEVLAHPGHGALEIHLHGWEYVLLAAAAVLVVICIARR